MTTDIQVFPEELNVDSLWGRDEAVTLIADLFPAQISPRPQWLPRTKIRAIITDRAVIFAWASSGGTGVSSSMMRYDADRAQPNFRGGVFHGISVTRGPGCACGSRGVRGWIPFGGRHLRMRTGR